VINKNPKGIFLTVSILLIGLAFTFFIYKLYSGILPSQKLLERLEDVKTYPSSTSWRVEKLKDLCAGIFCEADHSPRVRIFFETKDSWLEVSNFYISSLNNLKWKIDRNSESLGKRGTFHELILSKDGCKLLLYNFFNWVKDGRMDVGQYSIEIKSNDPFGEGC
jgi:hypothetical protein